MEPETVIDLKQTLISDKLCGEFRTYLRKLDQNKTCTNLTLYKIWYNAKQDHKVLNATLNPFLFYGHCIITNLAWPELGFRVRSFKGGFNETRPLLISYKSCPHHKLSSIHIDSQLGSNGLLLSVCVFDRSASG